MKLLRILISFLVCVLALSLVRNVYAYTVLKRWQNNYMSYWFDGSYSNYGGQRWIDRARDVVYEWNMAGVNFAFYEISSPNVLKALYMPSCNCTANTVRTWNSNYLLQAVIQVNTSVPQYDGSQAPTLPSNYYDLRTVLRHEFGHATGLCHSTGTQSPSWLMAYTPLGQVRYVDSDAKNGAMYLYKPGYSGPPPSSSCIN
jgi:hypothetical protein